MYLWSVVLRLNDISYVFPYMQNTKSIYDARKHTRELDINTWFQTEALGNIWK